MSQDLFLRCIGIGILTVGLLGLFVLSGAGWTVDATLADGSSEVDEIGAFQEANLDIGAQYRDSRPISTDGSAVTNPTMTVVAVTDPSAAGILFAPDDQSTEIRISGLRYLYFVSIFGAALVGVRAFLGWRINIRQLALEPRESRLFARGETVSSPPPVVERQSRYQE